jgi:hypothetical protein
MMRISLLVAEHERVSLNFHTIFILQRHWPLSRQAVAHLSSNAFLSSLCWLMGGSRSTAWHTRCRAIGCHNLHPSDEPWPTFSSRWIFLLWPDMELNTSCSAVSRQRIPYRVAAGPSIECIGVGESLSPRARFLSLVQKTSKLLNFGTSKAIGG